MQEENPRKNLANLVNELCKSGLTNLDESKLKLIKSFCKESDENLKFCYEIVNTELNKEHSEVRFAAFQIIDCLFQRSHLFRELMLEDFQEFFELVLETNPDEPLPPPRKAANELKKLASKTLKIWYDKFGSEYKLLDLGFNYLKNCKKIDFVSFSHQNNAQRAHNVKLSEKQQIIINKRYKENVDEMNDKEQDIKNCVDQLDRCIKILLPNEDLFNKEDFNLSSSKKTPDIQVEDKIENEEEEDEESSDDEDDFEEVPMKKTKEETVEESNLELNYLGFLNGSTNSAEDLKNTRIKIDLFLKENDENKVIIEIMRDLYKELKNSHLLKINNWIKNFGIIKESADNLKKAIELKNLIQSVLKRLDDLNIKPLVESDQSKSKTNVNIPKTTSKSDQSKPCTSKSISIESSTKSLSEQEKKKQEMLKIAPVINFDEVEFLAPLVQRVETNHPLFQRRENELPQDIMENAPRLTKKTFIGTEQPIKWSCRAPLKSGKLCPRMDRFKCPLHGKIVARNEMGEIVNEKDLKEAEKNKKEVAPWLDAELIADINAATGQNLQVVGEKKKPQKRKSGNLTDLNKEKDTSRNRLEKRLLDSKNLKKIGSILDSIERKHNYEKFHHNFNYSIQS